MGCKFAFQNVFTNSFQKLNFHKNPWHHTTKRNHIKIEASQKPCSHTTNHYHSNIHEGNSKNSHNTIIQNFRDLTCSQGLTQPNFHQFSKFRHSGNSKTTHTTRHHHSTMSGTSHVARPHPIHSFIIHFSIHSFIIHFSGISAHTMAKEKN